jgi:hypothetical protein
MNEEYRGLDKVQPYVSEAERQQQLVDRYRERQKMQLRNVPAPGRPEHEAGDIRTWWGGRRQSSALQRHHGRMDGIYYAARQAAYVQESVLALEYYGFVTSVRTIEAEQQELSTTDPNTLAGQIAEEMLMDSAERIRIASTDIQTDFRRKTLGSQ